MRRIVFFLIFTGCVFTLLQCDNSGTLEDGFHIDPMESWDYSIIAFIARITDNSADWSLCTMDKSGNGMRKIVDKTVTCQKPVRSNSGRQLLFTAVKFDNWVDENNSFRGSSEYELCIVNTDGEWHHHHDIGREKSACTY